MGKHEIIVEEKKKTLFTLQCFKASLYSLFLIASLALFRAVFTSLLDILSRQKHGVNTRNRPNQNGAEQGIHDFFFLEHLSSNKYTAYSLISSEAY